MTGNVVIDDNADRDPNYWVWNYMEGEEKMKPWLELRMTEPNNKVYTIIFTE